MIPAAFEYARAGSVDEARIGGRVPVVEPDTSSEAPASTGQDGATRDDRAVPRVPRLRTLPAMAHVPVLSPSTALADRRFLGLSCTRPNLSIRLLRGQLSDSPPRLSIALRSYATWYFRYTSTWFEAWGPRYGRAATGSRVDSIRCASGSSNPASSLRC